MNKDKFENIQKRLDVLSEDKAAERKKKDTNKAYNIATELVAGMIVGLIIGLFLDKLFQGTLLWGT